jgi:uncharacterized protein with NAD-binding domain and iron-sulfur cluster
MTDRKRTKIAILGGGVGALTTAFELTEWDKTRGHYDITVYTIGWRLGGKGAVGRNKEKQYRAEEHGLHVWPGHYDHAFDLVQRCYAAYEAEVKEIPPFGSWREAFRPLNQATVMEKLSDESGTETWVPWRLNFPPNELTPGLSNTASVVDFLKLLVTHAHDHFILSGLRDFATPVELHTLPSEMKDWRFSPRDLASGLHGLARSRVDALPPKARQVTKSLRDEVGTIIRAFREQVQNTDPNIVSRRTALRHARTLIDLGLTIAIGIIEDNVLARGFDPLDAFEWRGWLKRHRCKTESLESPFVRACYDLVFAYPHGKRNVGAGTATRVLLRLLFAYKGAFFYIMQATMGELIFAPLYLLLRKRGVRFEFFHRVKDLSLSKDKRMLDSITLGAQATVKKQHGSDRGRKSSAADRSYFPLIRIEESTGAKLWSWPSEPLYEQLERPSSIKAIDLESAWGPDTTRETILKRGDKSNGFDIAVLAIGIGAFPYICKSLLDKNPSGWRKMVRKIKTISTIGLQLWVEQTTEDLGWPDSRTVLTAFDKVPTPNRADKSPRMHTWGDMSLLLDLEQWPDHATRRVRTLGYFVGNLVGDEPCPEKPGSDTRATKDVDKLMRSWIKSNLPELWAELRNYRDVTFTVQNAGPGKREGRITWRRSAGRRGGGSPPTVVASYYLRVNINPSDRYVLSVKDSLDSRMTADGSGIGNLYLAGDWVRTGLNAGCVEAAVMAGQAAAKAIREA